VVMQYKSLKNRKEIEREKLAEQIRLQARQAIDACNSAAKVYLGRQLSLTSSEEEERVTSDQFEQGLITLYELLDSNRRTLVVRNQAIQARYNLLREIANLKQVMGIPVEEWY
jgi:outer membrane protein TolC